MRAAAPCCASSARAAAWRWWRRACRARTRRRQRRPPPSSTTTTTSTGSSSTTPMRYTTHLSSTTFLLNTYSRYQIVKRRYTARASYRSRVRSPPVVVKFHYIIKTIYINQNRETYPISFPILYYDYYYNYFVPNDYLLYKNTVMSTVNNNKIYFLCFLVDISRRYTHLSTTHSSSIKLHLQLHFSYKF